MKTVIICLSILYNPPPPQKKKNKFANIHNDFRSNQNKLT
jgi:hypothetical protein